MKRFHRRQFLKTAGAVAGAALLGQGCAPLASPTPPGLEDLLEEVDLKIDGENVVIPQCCTYTGKYYIDHPPKRLIYADWAQHFIPVIHLLEDAKTRPMLNSSEAFINGISDCLGFAVDKLFLGDIHSARNALAVVAYMLLHSAQIELWLKVPKGLAAQDPKSWLTIHYRNKDAGTDLWDMLPFIATGGSSGGTPDPAIQAKVNGFLGGGTGFDPRISEWLQQLVVLANMLDLWAVFGKEVQNRQTEFQGILDKFKEAAEQCPAGYDCEGMTVSDEKMLARLAAFGITFTETPTFPIAMMAIWGESNNRIGAITDMINGHQASDEDVESKLVELGQLLEANKGVVLEWSKKIDEAQHEAAEYDELRKKAAEPELSIWELIPYCLKDATIDKFEESLHAWWGAKKYIVAVGCSIIHVPIIIASAGLAVIPAIYDFVVCYLEGMIGSAAEIVEDFSICVVENW
jgi:hypothetical protein